MVGVVVTKVLNEEGCMRGMSWNDAVKRASLGLLAVAATMVATGATLSAQKPPTVIVPEINGASLSAGLGLLGAGLLWLRARRKMK
jgi:MYXO-CTERM domain-containing protein